MPFGASLLEDGRCRFALWAPSAVRVDLLLEEGAGAGTRPMRRDDDGRWVLEAPALAGTRYRFRIDGSLTVPDPASRRQPKGVHGASEVVDPRAYEWRDRGWKGRPWHEAVVYELHVGAFSRPGTFAAVEARLDALAGLGVTALELMPVNDFPGRRGWGYDGVLPFAPKARYGRPGDLKRLVDAAHARGLMVLLDVVYNHFGPDGNYLHAYAREFFTDRHRTPWGEAINLDGPQSAAVREFFIHNALYWLEEFHLDGLRVDAVHALHDDSRPDFVEELAARIAAGPGRGREVHLVLENHDNESRYLSGASVRGAQASAQWNDDFHHALHVIVTGETDGYYADFADDPVGRLGRCLAEGFAFQGEASPFGGGQPRGEPSTGLPPTAFVSFLQNHDQVGNRAFGERLVALAPEPALRAAAAILLLSPQVPMLFMGEEFAAGTPFLYFCDFGEGLAAAVRDGRRREFGRFARFADPASREAIPDPNAAATFAASRLRHSEGRRGAHRRASRLHRELLALRHERIVPLIPRILAGGSSRETRGRGLRVRWPLDDGRALTLAAQLDAQRGELATDASGEILYDSHPEREAAALGPWQVVVALEGRAAGRP